MNIVLIVGIALPFIMQPKLAQSSLNHRAKQKEWDKKPSQQESREIIITETELNQFQSLLSQKISLSTNLAK